MRLTLLAAVATATLYGCASAPKADVAPPPTADASRSEAGVPVASITPTPKYVLQRPGAERFSELTRQSGHFSTPYLIVSSADRPRLHRFQAATGIYQDELGVDLPEGVKLGKPQALTTFGKELWVADGSTGTLHRFFGFDPRYLESVRHEALKSPIAQLHVAVGTNERLLFVLDRDGDQLQLHRFELRLQAATESDQPEKIELGKQSSLALGAVRGIPTLLADGDAERLVLIHGNEVKAWNLNLEERPSPFAFNSLSDNSVGGGLLACSTNLDKGYWFVAEASGGNTVLHFMHYEGGAHRASVRLPGIDWSSGFLFDRNNMALFPSGAVFAIENGVELRAYAWNEIVRAVDLRAHCF
jgi:hypothetical protein